MVNNKLFDLRPVSELFSIVRNDLKKLDEEGLIDEGTLIKEVMKCNEKLGIYVREVKEACIPVNEYKAKLPDDFEKLYFVAALSATNTAIHNHVNPLNNNFDADVIYEAKLDRGVLGCAECYNVTIKRNNNTTVHQQGVWTPLSVNLSSSPNCHTYCPNLKKKGKYEITIDNEYIHTPFRSGELYIMYIGAMKDKEGNILFPFHPLITPYYEWALKEKIIMDAIFNSEGNYAELLKLAQSERVKAWIDAFSITTDKDYGWYVDMQKKKELSWWNKYFKYLQ